MTKNKLYILPKTSQSAHSMARGNLSKSSELVTNTTAASKYLRGQEYASLEIPSFRPHLIKFSKTVFYEVNLASQYSNLKFSGAYTK